jgi:hypothetical protein
MKDPLLVGVASVLQAGMVGAVWSVLLARDERRAWARDRPSTGLVVATTAVTVVVLVNIVLRVMYR